MGRNKYDDEYDDYPESSRERGRFQAPADFDGPTASRSCTDLLFAMLIMLCWGAMSGIGIYSYNNGDHRAVLYPMDYEGNICGTDFGNGTDMTAYPKIVYVNKFLGGVCVEECPKVEDLVDPRTLITYNGVYQEEGSVLNASFVNMPDYNDAENVLSCTETLCSTDPNISWTRPGISKGYGFAYYALDTYEVLGVRCISNPSAKDKLRDLIQMDNDPLDIDIWTNTQEFFGNLYGDIFVARYYVLMFGIAAAMFIGFVYAQLLRFQPLLGFMIWGSILASIGIVLGLGGYAYKVATDWEADDPQVRSDFDIQGTKIFSYVLFAVGAIVIFLTIFLRQQIMLAMACVREAARAIGAMPLIVLFPVFQTIAFLAFMAVWIFYAVHLASTGEITEMELPVDAVVTVREYTFDDLTKQLGWYLIFCFFWTITFIQAMGEIVIAMSVSKWYFTRDKRDVGSLTIFASIFQAFRYHLGTAAFGSFIIAVTKIIRMIVARAQKKARQLGNKLGEALLCCCQCCLWCFEKFIQFLNKNAYIQTAIFGTPFCRSAREAFSLIARNAGKVASITYVSGIVLFVGKFFISSVTTAAAYVYIHRDLGEQLYSLAGPCGIIFIMSYYIGDMFLDIFDMSTATVLHCFVADEEMFDGDECYAEGELRDWLDDFEENEKRIVAGY
jgi:hypothetical protein